MTGEPAPVHECGDTPDSALSDSALSDSALRDDVLPALIEQLHRNWERGDNVANDELVMLIREHIRRQQAAAQPDDYDPAGNEAKLPAPPGS